jgi:hypothetical protein
MNPIPTMRHCQPVDEISSRLEALWSNHSSLYYSSMYFMYDPRTITEVHAVAQPWDTTKKELASANEPLCDSYRKALSIHLHK